MVALPPRLSYTIGSSPHSHAKQNPPAMPKRCPPNQIRRALHPLDLNENNRSMVQCPTAIPSSAIRDWSNRQLPDNPDLSGQKMFPLPDNIREKRIASRESLPPPNPPQKPCLIHTMSVPFRVLSGVMGMLLGCSALSPFAPIHAIIQFPTYVDRLVNQ